MRPDPVGLRRLTGHPRLVDLLLAVLALGIALAGLSDGGRGRGRDDGSLVATHPTAGAVLLLLVASVVLLGRRDRPVVVAVVVAAGVVGAVLAGGSDPLVAAPLLVALFTLGQLAPLRTTVATLVGTGIGYVLALAAVQGAYLDERGDSPALTALALGSAAAAVGLAVRGQQSALAAARARAAQAEASREEEAQRRVTDERLRIARDLHDVVAHHVAVVTVQAGVARHLMDRDPDQARHALGLVREASTSVLTELTAVLGLLRTDAGDAPAEPAPGLSRLDALLDSARTGGLTVDRQDTGEPLPLAPVHDLTAYRVVQESLTNAAKHGDGQATLVLHHGPQEVVVEIANAVAPRVTAGSGGHGLIGMRERVTAVGGRLEVGPDGAGRWRVRATVPRGTA